MRRLLGWVLTLATVVVLTGCGQAVPTTRALTEEEERQHQEQLKRAREEEGGGGTRP